MSPNSSDAAKRTLPASVTLLPIQLHALVLGLFASLVAPFGGFFASGIKRAYNLDDFASIIPGHGGLLDRVDGLLTASLALALALWLALV